MEFVIGSHWVVSEMTYEGGLRHIQVHVKNGMSMMPLTYERVSIDMELEKEKVLFRIAKRDE